jgi:VanZ family protein
MSSTTPSLVWKLSFWSLLVLTLWLSLIPVSQLPSELHFWDKAEHALGFAGLGFLGCLSYPGRTRWVVVGLVLFGAAVECAQALTGWRTGDWADWVADCVGLALGMAALQAVYCCRGWWFQRANPRSRS